MFYVFVLCDIYFPQFWADYSQLILSIIKDFLLRKTGAYECDEYILRFVKEYINDNFHHRFDKKKNAKQYTKITAKALLNSPSELTSG